jgi:hypothetical protein
MSRSRRLAPVGVGINSTAWTASSQFQDKEGRGRNRVVVLGPNCDARVIRHEAAHVWHSTVTLESETPPIAVTGQGEVGLRALAARDGWLEAADAGYQRGERIADALALLWESPL